MQSQQVMRALRQIPWEPPDPDVRTRAYRCSAVRRPIGSFNGVWSYNGFIQRESRGRQEGPDGVDALAALACQGGGVDRPLDEASVNPVSTVGLGLPKHTFRRATIRV